MTAQGGKMRQCVRASRIVAVLLAFASVTATGQDYPSKPIRIIGAASGGNSD
jgi:hypothetical protein